MNVNKKMYQDELLSTIGPRSIRLMRRCFMTGKQCIFSSQIAEYAGREMSIDDFRVFVVMPFRPNLETFYLWSLKPFLIQGYGFDEKNVQRADEVRDIGYIVCEKICRKIQEADLVLADVSLSNANVFYEIGLAYGLERPVVLLQNKESNEGVLSDRCFRQSLNLNGHKTLDYPGIEELKIDADEHKLTKYIIHPPKQKGQIGELKISFLSVKRGEANEGVRAVENQDVNFAFNKILFAAIGVSMADIRADLEKESEKEFTESWQKVVADIDDARWKIFSSAHPIEVDGRGSFIDIAEKIMTSFCTIIDVSENDPVACFWLGYCHARGLNVIPVNRLTESSSTQSQTTKATYERISRLAFDIRALWYAEYESQKPYTFKAKLREILEHLLARDLPDRQKRLFWDRFPPERKLKVFTGAIHNKDLNREMVGDWDVRTVSELFSYLPSVRESLAIELVTPLYSPEEAYRRAGENVQIEKDSFIDAYNQSLEEQLKDSNAIVIASPDVNPVTEYLLHKLYEVKKPAHPFKDCKTPVYNGYVAWKKLKKTNQNEAKIMTVNNNEENSPSNNKEAILHGYDYKQELIVKFNRLFYKQEEIEGEDTMRGFGIHTIKKFQESEELMKKYLSQDECKEPFDLLGHIVISRYPRDTQRGNLVVLLNGVSGPATFALAQMLTGGVFGQSAMKAKSEQMLTELNEELDKSSRESVEAIVKVRIAPQKDTEFGKNRTYEDNRQILDWDFIIKPKEIGKI